MGRGSAIEGVRRPGVGAYLRGTRAIVSFACVAALAPGQSPPEEPPVPPPVSTEFAGPPPADPGAAPTTGDPALPALTPAYRSFADARAWLEACAASAPQSARVFDLAPSYDGRAVPAIEIAVPGPMPPRERPTVLVIGALDGRSLAGTEAVLAVVHAALSEPQRLSSDATLIAIPWPAPEALEALANGGAGDGRNPQPFDDDRDGRVDEDGPDDLNEDGLVLDMLIEDEAGPWTLAADGRFLAAARGGDRPRYLKAREGRDDDGDGRFNEDPPGGVVLDRSFPLHRTGAWQDPRCGVLPLGEPVARACADLALERRIACTILFQGNHGGLAIPGGVAALDTAAALDAPAYRQCATLLEARTGRKGCAGVPLREAWGEERPGSALDWFAGVPGALALEVAPWGARIEPRAEAAPRDARYEPASAGPGGARSPLDERSRAWAAWLDNVRGGLGFVAWTPLELGRVRGLVGGFEPWTIDNPPPEALAPALTGLAPFVLDVVAALPRLEVRAATPTREGDVCTLRARVANAGTLPTSLASAAAHGAGRVTLDLELAGGARLIAGEARRELPRLQGGEVSAEVSWIVLAPPGSAISVRARAPWCADLVHEVRP